MVGGGTGMAETELIKKMQQYVYFNFLITNNTPLQWNEQEEEETSRHLDKYIVFSLFLKLLMSVILYHDHIILTVVDIYKNKRQRYFYKFNIIW